MFIQCLDDYLFCTFSRYQHKILSACTQLLPISTSFPFRETGFQNIVREKKYIDTKPNGSEFSSTFFREEKKCCFHLLHFNSHITEERNGNYYWSPFNFEALIFVIMYMRIPMKISSLIKLGPATICRIAKIA